MQSNARAMGVDRRRFLGLGLGLAGVALGAAGCDSGSSGPQKLESPAPPKVGGARKLLDSIKNKASEPAAKK